MVAQRTKKHERTEGEPIAMLPRRPVALVPIFENIPLVLRQDAQWLLWKYSLNSKRVWKKPPYGVENYPISATNPQQWDTFERVQQAHRKGGFDGIGRGALRSDNLGYIDWDNCVDAATGVIHPAVLDILTRFGDCYVEYSPSRKGIRLVMPVQSARKPAGSIPAGNTFNGVSVEMYVDKKYLTLTGHTIEGYTGGCVVDQTDAFCALFAEVKAYNLTRKKPPKGQQATHPTKQTAPKVPPRKHIHTDDEDDYSLDDDSIIRLAQASPTPDPDYEGMTKGELFTERFAGSCEFDQQEDTVNGGTKDDPSGRDSSLCDSLAWWTRRDDAQMFSIFMQSGCATDERVGAKRPTLASYKRYVRRTIHDSLGRNTDMRPWKEGDEGTQVVGGGRACAATPYPFTILSDLEEEEVTWFWGGSFPRGKLVIVSAEGGKGKSIVMTDVLARNSRGERMPHENTSLPLDDGTQAGGVIIAEDGACDTIKPRLRVAGAKQERILDLTLVHPDPAHPNPAKMRPFSLKTDMPLLEQGARSIHAAYVLIDPLAMVSNAKTDSHNYMASYRDLLELSALAERTHCTVICIMHNNKTETMSLVNRVSGSTAYTAAARAVFTILDSPDEGEEDIKLFVHIKANLSALAKPLRFRLRMSEDQQPYVEWLGVSQHSNAELTALLAQQAKQQKDAKKAKGAVRIAIMQLLQEKAPQDLSPNEVWLAIAGDDDSIEYENVKQTLRRMERDDQVRRTIRGLYTTAT